MAVAVSALQSVEQELLTAIRAGNVEDARFWLADDAIDVSGSRRLPSGELFLPLRDAIRTGSVDMVKLVLEAGADARSTHSFGSRASFVPLLEAIRSDSVDIVKLVLDAGASPDVFYTDGFGGSTTAMAVAIELGNRQIITSLRDAQR